MSTTTALFYPNLLGVLEVKTHRKRFTATNDYGAACFEQRSFIDQRALLRLRDGRSMLEDRVSPVPPCFEIFGGRGDWSGVRVVGMLRDPLEVSWTSPSGVKLELVLQNVLIIDPLPVPLHISLKSIGNSFRGDPTLLHEMTLQMMDQPRITGKTLHQRRDDFPPEYHSHPYWNSDDLVLGLTPNMEEQRLHLSQTITPSTGHARKCALCDGMKDLQVCSSCRAVWYCGKEHQKQHWRVHKNECKGHTRK